jgi:hypothetical protein
VLQLCRYKKVQSTLNKLVCSTQGYECTADSSRWAAVHQHHIRVGYRLFKMQNIRISMMLGLLVGMYRTGSSEVKCVHLVVQGVTQHIILYIVKQQQLY